jgi:hypothetical protein
MVRDDVFTHQWMKHYSGDAGLRRRHGGKEAELFPVHYTTTLDRHG